MKDPTLEGPSVGLAMMAQVKLDQEKKDLALMINDLNRKIDALNENVRILTMDKNTLTRANRDLQTQIHSVKECFEIVVTKLTGRNSD